MLKQALEVWTKEAPKLAEWAEENLPMGFAVFDLPEGHRTRARTTNGLERINREIKRRLDLLQRRILPAARFRLMKIYRKIVALRGRLMV